MIYVKILNKNFFRLCNFNHWKPFSIKSFLSQIKKISAASWTYLYLKKIRKNFVSDSGDENQNDKIEGVIKS